MKIKIELENGESPDLADDLLQKALLAKKECSGHEQYSDSVYNEFVEYIHYLHHHMISNVEDELKEILSRARS